MQLIDQQLNHFALEVLISGRRDVLMAGMYMLRRRGRRLRLCLRALFYM